MKKFTAYFYYAIKNRRLTALFLISLLALLLFDWLSKWVFLDDLKTYWSDEVSQLVTFSTLFVAIAVWVAELIQEWRAQLPKRLTVDFLYPNDNSPKKVMRAEKAHLSDTADIRALGQQIGSQLVKPGELSQLKFRAPYVKQEKGNIEHLNDIGFFQHYTVSFTLTELPEGLDPDECKTWVEPFDINNISTCRN